GVRKQAIGASQEGQGKARQTGHQDRVDPLHARPLRLRRHRRCPESAGDALVLRLVLHPASGADPKYAGLRPKELRNSDQGRNGLSAPWLAACSLLVWRVKKTQPFFIVGEKSDFYTK